jgi:hypothetical protein
VGWYVEPGYELVSMVSCRLMLGFRRWLSRFAGGWLLCQFCIWTLTPAALCAAIPSTADSVECTCPHGGAQVCPMHQTQSKSKTRSCSCRGTTDSAATLIAGLFGPAAVLAVPIAAAEPADSSQRPAHLESRPLDFCLVPDAPPPRA